MFYHRSIATSGSRPLLSQSCARCRTVACDSCSWLGYIDTGWKLYRSVTRVIAGKLPSSSTFVPPPYAPAPLLSYLYTARSPFQGMKLKRAFSSALLAEASEVHASPTS